MLADRSLSQTAPASPPAASTNVEEWRATDLSLLDFVADGYDLVSVVSPSSHTRLYFLTKPGKIVKCREEATPALPLFHCRRQRQGRPEHLYRRR